MIINKIVLENVGLYYGKQVFDLSNDHAGAKRNIVLFGGLNGAGKTTLFDAVRLCLYGREIFPRISDNEYEEYLLNKIHHSFGETFQETYALVGLEFEYSHFGEVNTYFVERKWTTDGSKNVEEILSITKDDEKLVEVKQEEWQDFIKDLIPPGLSQLFFFDGEKIQKIIEDNNNAEFKSSVKMLLGLDLIERLMADLKIFKSRSLKELSPKQFKKELDELNQEKESLEISRKVKREKRSSIENDVMKLKDKIDSYMDKMRSEGDCYFKRQEELTRKRLGLERESEILKEKLREVATGALPLAIASKQAIALKDQVEKEEAMQTDRLAGSKLKAKKNQFMDKVRSNNIFQSLGTTHQEQLNTVLEKEFDTLLAFDKGEKEDVIFGFSTSQSERLLSVIDKALNEIPGTLEELSKQHDKSFKKLRDTVSDLKRVPDESTVKPMYETLNQLNQDLGKLHNEQKHLDESVRTFDYQIEEIDRKIEKINRQIEANVKRTVKIKNAQGAETVLSVYKEKLAVQKVEAFKEEFLKIFQELHRKKDVIRQVEINPKTFDIFLYDNKQALIKPETLSAGEKEIYAIALLTALAKSSGQNLPFIIDMPLGRLDTFHRERIVNRFFPHASHQMIIFSTNTEIDREYFEILKPYITRSYNLNYDQEKKRTAVEEGYFWN